MSEPIQLTDEELLALNNIIYLHEFGPAGLNEETGPQTVGEILEDINWYVDAGNVEVIGSGRNSRRVYPAAMTRDEWDNIINLVQNCERLRNLEVHHPRHDQITDAVSVVFVDPANRYHGNVVFRGTGENQWRDNAQLLTMIATQCQLAAQEWVAGLTEFSSLTLSGHSKGANTAVFVGIQDERVVNVVGFDTPGFSNAFHRHFEDLLNQRADIVTLYANDLDFINILLQQIGVDINFFANPNVQNFKNHHSPNTGFMMDENGYILSLTFANYGTDLQHPVMEMLNRFTLYLLENASPGEQRYIMSVMGELLISFMGNDDYMRNRLLNRFGPQGALLIFDYLREFLIYLQETDPAAYVRYRHAMTVLAGSIYFDSVENPTITMLLTTMVLGNQSLNILEGVGDYARFFNHLFGATIRDFSEQTKDELIRSAENSRFRDKSWLDWTRWGVSHLAEVTFPRLSIRARLNSVSNFLDDVNEIRRSNVDNIKRVFEEVRSLDASHASQIESSTDELTQVTNKLEQLVSRIS
ncbi:MAG: DUF2974 domain-containing protein [Oscillospiraceae bacterium]|nr:DUF2974 domain-containing protein [Oscillospiraceae bacterium]